MGFEKSGLDSDTFGEELKDEEIREETAEEAEETAEETAEEAEEEAAEETEETAEEEPAGESDTETEADEDEDEDGGEEEYAEDGDGEVRVCPHCRKNPVYYGHEYCYQCEKELLKTKIPVAAWIAGLAGLALSFFCFVIVCLVSAPSLQVLEGDAAADKKNWFSAYEEYSDVEDVLTEITDTVGENAVITPLLQTGSGLEGRIYKAVRHVYDPIQAYSYASQLITNTDYLAHDKTYKECEEYYEVYESTYTALSDALEYINSLESFTKEDCEKTITMMEAHRGETGVNDVWLDYYIYNVAGYAGYSEEELLERLDTIHEADEKEGGTLYWVYYDDYIADLVRADRDDEAKTLIETQRADDISDYDPVYQLLRIYIKAEDFDSAQDLVDDYCAENLTTDDVDSDSNLCLKVYLARAQGNTDEAKEYIDTALESYSLIPEFNRQLALIYLLDGDYDNAFEAAVDAEDAAYYRYSYYSDSTGYTDELSATLYVCTKLCQLRGSGESESADNIQDILDSFDDTTYVDQMADIINGKVSLKEVLTTGVCDLI